MPGDLRSLQQSRRERGLRVQQATRCVKRLHHPVRLEGEVELLHILVLTVHLLAPLDLDGAGEFYLAGVVLGQIARVNVGVENAELDALKVILFDPLPICDVGVDILNDCLPKEERRPLGCRCRCRWLWSFADVLHWWRRRLGFSRHGRHRGGGLATLCDHEMDLVLRFIFPQHLRQRTDAFLADLVPDVHAGDEDLIDGSLAE